MINHQKSVIQSQFYFSNTKNQAMQNGGKSIDELKQSIKGKLSYLYPAQRQPSCFGKGAFKSRFPRHAIADQKCFCSKMCSFLCYFLCEKRVNQPEDQEQLERLLPITTPKFTSSQNKITYTWIGHSTAVISIGNQANIMIDPIFSLRCSPFQWVGPKRYRMPACKVDSLPPIHCVLVSHDHYDHLDSQSLQDIQKLHRPIFIAGLDSQSEFPEGSKLVEMDWATTKEIEINGHKFEITFVPVCHWAKRKFYEKNTRLWGGFVIKTPKGQKIFYPGDTAYCEIFEEVGEKYGPFDLSILPIGAYLPRHIMQTSHVDPEEAVIIHKQLRSKQSVGVHWGTFPLGFQPWYQPKLDLEKAKIKYAIKQEEFVTLAHGESITVGYQ